MTTQYAPALSGAQVDRAAGVLLATACGDALGAGYEFGPPLSEATSVGMVGGGSFAREPGEWTDDTSMAVAIAEATATGADPRTPAVLDAIATRWVAWSREASDVGAQTRVVLSAASVQPTGAALAAAAKAHHVRFGRSGGNGSLRRTAPLTLAYLHDPDALVEAAHTLSALTHYDPEAGEACALWCLAIRYAVLHGTLDGLRAALDTLPTHRAAVWAARLDESEVHPPAHFDHNGWVVQALQGAWSAITRTPVPADDPGAGTHPAQHLQLALEAAVRGGRDTDAVAAIAGGLLGARWGSTAVPAAWRREVHGWPGYRARNVQRLAIATARRSVGAPPDDAIGWPSVPAMPYTGWPGAGTLVVHPDDDGVLLGGFRAVTAPPDGVDAVVSLCRLGWAQWPAPGVAERDHVTVWLADDGPDHNPHLDYVLRDAAGAVAALRAEGRTVLLHCVAAQSRTPTVAALYSALHLGIGPREAVGNVLAALPDAAPNRHFQAAIRRLTAGAASGQTSGQRRGRR